MQEMTADERHWRHAPRWEALIAALAIGSAYAVLPDNIRLGPRWLLAALIVLFAIPLNGARYLGNYRLVRIIGMALSALVTAALAASAVLLIVRLPSGKTPATHLLRDGALIWVINVLVFAIWYWELDCGGPHARHIKRYTSTDFLFPQMTMPDAEEKNWSPLFLDYLFQAFNTSAAFSPTDVLILSRRAKVLMMMQSLISLVVVAVLVSRAINTLGN
ncbi:MAG: hypothetical protein M3176_05830 [Chloroflexota bacterium]|nr:hypothetical protein [Chloroflexota bacterium]MDQ6906333.1 hypothetical protein [Chloroflexota bacterium]